MATIANEELKKSFITAELERRLKADNKGAERDQVLHELSACAEEMLRQRQSGLSPDDYFKSEKILASLRVAEQVIRRTWNSLHASPA